MHEVIQVLSNSLERHKYLAYFKDDKPGFKLAAMALQALSRLCLGGLVVYVYFFHR